MGSTEKLIPKVDISSTDIDHVYLDVEVYNNTMDFLPLNIQQNRTTPFLDTPEDFNVSIARFILDGGHNYRCYAPLEADADNTKEYIGLEWDGNYFDSPVVIPITKDPLGTNIRGVRTIYDFLKIVNSAFQTSLSALNLFPGYDGPTGNGYPCMTFDEPSQKYILNVPDWFGTDGTIKINCSYQFYNRFQSFPVDINVPLKNNKHDVTFNVYYSGNNRITGSDLYFGSTPPDYYIQCTQDKGWPSSIMDVSKISITTTTLPVIPEYVDQSPLGVIGGPGNVSSKILQDYIIGRDINLKNLNGESYVYLPNMYRQISMIGKTPLIQWDLNFHTISRDGLTFPYLLNPGGYATIKLAFIRKRVPV